MLKIKFKSGKLSALKANNAKKTKMQQRKKFSISSKTNSLKMYKKMNINSSNGRFSHGNMGKIGNFASKRTFASPIKEKLAELIPGWREEVKTMRKEHGHKVLGEVTVGQVYGGMRGIPALVTETSLLDAEEGIRFRGFSIPELTKVLPTVEGGEQPLPEGLFWLLLTGEVPTKEQVASLTKELVDRSDLSETVKTQIDAYPKTMHPMVQLSSAVLAAQQDSKFAKAYTEKSMNKNTMWEYALEDTLTLVGQLPEIAARIYSNVFKNGNKIAPDKSLDWAGNYANMLHIKGEGWKELMRLYTTIHTDHEGGNVSAHATHLVGSALSDPYLSFTAGMTGLAGPLHGLANQEVLVFINKLKEACGANPTAQEIEKFCWDTLKSGQVIPGYGHAVLRQTDPRYTCQREFALKVLPEDPTFKIVSNLYDIVPKVLKEHGKTANPWPNVDAHSGILLEYYGLNEPNYYTVLFGVSRSIGVLSNFVIERAVGMPIERPKSLTTELIKQKI